MKAALAYPNPLGCGRSVIAFALGHIVDLSVTIVIETIADLGGRQDLTDTGSPLPQITRLLAAFAESDVFGVSCPIVTIALGHIVDLSVAIVIEAIADLRGRDDLTDTSAPLSAATRLLSSLTDAFVSGVSCPFVTIAWWHIVDLSIAVVITVIADLGMGCYFIFTCRPRASVAMLLTIVTSANTLGGGVACIAIALDIFIDTAVAIVIEAIAEGFIFLVGGGVMTAPSIPFAARYNALTDAV